MSDSITRLNAALEGRYRVERELGEGGMATVYLADDLRHERKVALKVLKPELAAVVGAERFLAEIKTTANLHHPNILPLFDSGEADGFLLYVMPFIEGETLRDRIDREKQLPVDEAVRIVVSVANALQHAHDRGVIHRDIKPGNVLIQDDQPLVADFGIALAVGVAGGSRLTETGLSVGTPYYMSPEQATGDQTVGPASDVYALAAVLYEMLTGDPPYVGSTAQAVLGKILQGEPVSATAARKAVPGNVDAALRRALERLPADRFVKAQDFARALTDPTFRHGGAAVGSDAGARFWKAASVALGVALVATVAAAMLRPEPAPQPAVYLLGTQGWAGLEMPIGRRAALAPDGSSMVLPIETADGWMLGLKLRGSVEITPLSGTDGARDLVYSPDGRSIAYAVGRELRTRLLIGGSSLTLARDLEAGNRSSMDWLDDGTILFEQLLPGARQISRIPASGGDPIQVVLPATDVAPIWVRGLPGGRGVLLIDCEGSGVACTASRSRLHVIDMDDLSSRTLMEGVLAAWYVPSGHVLYVRADGSVFAQPFDLRTMELSGGAVPVLDGVRTGVNYADLQIAQNGTLMYVKGPANLPTGAGARAPLALRFVDRNGREEPVGFEPQPYDFPRFAPDGNRLAVVIQNEADFDIWTFDLERGARSRVTFGGVNRWYPNWTPTGDALVYSDGITGSNTIHMAPADGSARIEPLIERDGLQYPTSWSRDGRFLAFHENNPETGRDLWVRSPGGDAAPFLVTPFQEGGAVFSPDGLWLAYVSNKSGQQEVYVQAFPGPGPEYTISTQGGTEPLWSPDGRELFYRGEGQLMAVAVETEGGFHAEPPQPLFTDRYEGSPSGTVSARNYDISPDGRRFIMVSGAAVTEEAAEESTLILVEGFRDQIRERLESN